MKNLCAVDGCDQIGKPHICPHDGSHHYHGRVHYNCGCPVHSLKFRDGWHLLCDAHYKIVAQERKNWEQQQPKLQEKALVI